MSSKDSVDFGDWSNLDDFSGSVHSSVASSSIATDSTSILPGISASSRGTSISSKSQSLSSIADTVAVPLNPAVNLSFTKGSQLFKLRYTQINVCKDSAGRLRYLDLIGPPGDYSTFIHTFPNTKVPIPHIEHPYGPSSEPPFVVSFLEDQNITVAQVLFIAQPHYSFENWNDCVHFQEAILDQRLTFIAGISEVKSKGRGEECISQNIRVVQAKNSRQTLFYFANSLRKETKRYVSVPLDVIDSLDPGKKSSCRVTLKLTPTSDLLKLLRSLQIEFLDINDKTNFIDVVNTVNRRGSVA